MPIYMCRWPNGDLSFVSAPSKDDAIVMLDEWDNADVADLQPVDNFMVDFRLTDDGELKLNNLGEDTYADVWQRAYPAIGELRAEPAEAEIRAAVAIERGRMAKAPKGSAKQADTQAGRVLQDQLGTAAATANRIVDRAGRRILKKLPTDSGPKQ